MPKKLNTDGTPDCDYTDEVVCPHCGTESSDSREYFSPNSTEAGIIDCDACGEKFLAYAEYSVTYCTAKYDPRLYDNKLHTIFPGQYHVTEPGTRRHLLVDVYRHDGELFFRATGAPLNGVGEKLAARVASLVFTRVW